MPVKGFHYHNDICVPDTNPKNAPCKNGKENFSVTLGGECVSNCKDVTDPSKFVDVNGYHMSQNLCTADSPPSTTGNNACMSMKKDFSVN